MTLPAPALCGYIVVCSWCARVKTAVGWIVPRVPPTGRVSCGICPECIKAYFPEPPAAA